MISHSARLRRDSLAILRAALDAADASKAVRKHLSIKGSLLHAGALRLSLSNFDRIFLIAAGKAAIEMSTAVERVLGSRLAGGIAVTKHRHARTRLRKLQV
ncbi:MAG: DUF4147 domain-containing protein, partial [Acidobacteriaceae bacterium]|nr:DUF4147 domain-containing protein [Acidobacteriaceae bacterium]